MTSMTCGSEDLQAKMKGLKANCVTQGPYYRFHNEILLLLFCPDRVTATSTQDKTSKLTGYREREIQNESKPNKPPCDVDLSCQLDGS